MKTKTKIKQIETILGERKYHIPKYKEIGGVMIDIAMAKPESRLTEEEINEMVSNVLNNCDRLPDEVLNKVKKGLSIRRNVSNGQSVEAAMLLMDLERVIDELGHEVIQSTTAYKGMKEFLG